MKISNRDKFLAEAICKNFYKPTLFNCCTCQDCGHNNDECICIEFGEWYGFGKLWEWARLQNWWIDFEKTYDGISDWRFFSLDLNFIHPDKFADAIYEYLQNKEEKNGN